MTRFLFLLVTLLPLVTGCDAFPAPAQYDHAMLREYFGKSPREVSDTFGKPSSVRQADSQSPPKNATAEEQEKFKQDTEGMTYVYSTPDGNLLFQFNLNDEVIAITYAGEIVSPPEAR